MVRQSFIFLLCVEVWLYFKVRSNAELPRRENEWESKHSAS